MKTLRLIVALALLVIASLVVSVSPAAADKKEDATGNIAVTKMMCTSIGQNNTCNGRDTSLDGYKVDFQVRDGTATSGASIRQTITVTIGSNAGGGGNTGGGSQGRAVGADLPAGEYTVCELPTAYKSGQPDVELIAQARPSNSSGGTNQSSPNARCITVQLGSGTAELDFLDMQVAPQPTATPVPPTNTPVPPTATPQPNVEATPTATPSNQTEGSGATKTATPKAVTSGAQKAPTATPIAQSLPRTGEARDSSLTVIGLLLVLGGVFAYRVASAQRPATANDSGRDDGDWR